MRVIAGLYRHRELLMPKGNSTRPSKDIVKGGIFNALGQKVIGAKVLDLFAGSGALSIEAISRGASYAYLVDSSPEAKRAILTNLNNLKITNYSFLQMDYRKATTLFIKQQIKIDVLLLDPPYQMDNYDDIIQQVKPLLNDDAVIIVESEKPIKITNNYQRSKEYHYGRTFVTFLWQ